MTGKKYNKLNPWLQKLRKKNQHKPFGVRRDRAVSLYCMGLDEEENRVYQDFIKTSEDRQKKKIFTT